MAVRQASDTLVALLDALCKTFPASAGSETCTEECSSFLLRHLGLVAVGGLNALTIALFGLA